MSKIIKKEKRIKKIKSSILDQNLSSFIKQCFFTTNPGTEYLHNWHIDLIAEYLKACENGQIKRLIINIPPRYMKSLSVSVAWPAWLLGHNPARRIIAASYSQNLSLKHAIDSRLVMNSKWYKKIFPDTKFTKDQNEKEKFITSERGYRIATSVGGSITGEGGNFLIVDDPHNPSDIFSDNIRGQTNQWFDQVFSSRLDDKKKGVFVVVMQRLHQDDLTGHLLQRNQKAWEFLSLPVSVDKKTLVSFGDVDFTREAGSFLHPKREGREEIETAKKELGSYAFSAQYMQNPVPQVGGMIKPEWIRRTKDLGFGIQGNENLLSGNITQSWDTAIKAKQENDFSVCTTWAETENGFYLIDVFKKRMEYPELKSAVINMAAKWNPEQVLIEDKASGQSIIQDLKRETKLPVIPINSAKDKVTRMAVVSGLFEAGKIFLPKSADWIVDYELELFAFPNGKHDDQVDSTSQFLNWTRNKVKLQPKIRAI